ncbi:MAG: class I SAM-dependent methyltransferase [Deltaproteobacteria bacterium]|nr:class I SAM-dependent methyltransferase [Deltaproteobacteria bacterium]
MRPTPPEAGKSSFDLIHTERFFEVLPLAAIRRAVDLGCGVGRYSFPLAERLTAGASVQGFDLWPEGVQALRQSAVDRGVTNVRAEVADLSHLAGVPDGEFDLALMATVLHDLAQRGDAVSALREVARVLRPGGCLAVVEFKKAATQPGPPLAIRLAPDEVSVLVKPSGFSGGDVTDLGPHAYVSLFLRNPTA